MAEILLLHHAQGRTEGVLEFAEEIRQEGHTVHTPDLYGGGRTFDTLEEGVAYAEETGFEQLIDRGERAAALLPKGIVYAGLSLGVMPAQKLAQTREGARGALFFYSCIPSSYFGEWPTGLPVQIHGMQGDPLFTTEGDLEAARALVDSSDRAELFLYPGDRHIFADPSLDSYDEDAALLLKGRVLQFLGSLD